MGSATNSCGRLPGTSRTSPHWLHRVWWWGSVRPSYRDEPSEYVNFSAIPHPTKVSRFLYTVAREIAGSSPRTPRKTSSAVGWQSVPERNRWTAPRCSVKRCPWASSASRSRGGSTVELYGDNVRTPRENPLSDNSRMHDRRACVNHCPDLGNRAILGRRPSQGLPARISGQGGFRACPNRIAEPSGGP